MNFIVRLEIRYSRILRGSQHNRPTLRKTIRTSQALHECSVVVITRRCQRRNPGSNPGTRTNKFFSINLIKIRIGIYMRKVNHSKSEFLIVTTRAVAPIARSMRIPTRTTEVPCSASQFDPSLPIFVESTNSMV